MPEEMLGDGTMSNCIQCDRTIPNGARYCQHCGTRQPDQPAVAPLSMEKVPSSPPTTDPNLKKALLAIALVVVAIIVVNALSRAPTTASPSSATADSMENAADAAMNAAGNSDAVSSPWSYSKKHDDVRNGDIVTASSRSTNSIDLDFPYAGGTWLTVTVRKHPAWGTDVYFSINQGQLICHSYDDGCYATVRFDDDPAKRFYLNEPSDNSSDTVFVRGAQGFINKLAKAKKLVVELEFYKSGRPQFTLDVSHLHWPPKASDL